MLMGLKATSCIEISVVLGFGSDCEEIPSADATASTSKGAMPLCGRERPVDESWKRKMNEARSNAFNALVTGNKCT